ncbi:MAG: hypothetical protein IPJ04_00520 [Candidatus Eisenbacteria bacterium]|nr:hypothetical protein [Candidatus Eisenbacteria bacterium]
MPAVSTRFVPSLFVTVMLELPAVNTLSGPAATVGSPGMKPPCVMPSKPLFAIGANGCVSPRSSDVPNGPGLRSIVTLPISSGVRAEGILLHLLDFALFRVVERARARHFDDQSLVRLALPERRELERLGRDRLAPQRANVGGLARKRSGAGRRCERGGDGEHERRGQERRQEAFHDWEFPGVGCRAACADLGDLRLPRVVSLQGKDRSRGKWRRFRAGL